MYYKASDLLSQSVAMNNSIILYPDTLFNWRNTIIIVVQIQAVLA